MIVALLQDLKKRYIHFVCEDKYVLFMFKVVISGIVLKPGV